LYELDGPTLSDLSPTSAEISRSRKSIPKEENKKRETKEEGSSGKRQSVSSEQVLI
jgi:hypothetical protein